MNLCRGVVSEWFYTQRNEKRLVQENKRSREGQRGEVNREKRLSKKENVLAMKLRVAKWEEVSANVDIGCLIG